MVYDVSNRATFDNVAMWMNEAREMKKSLVFMLVGNKADLESQREVSYEEGKAFADLHDMSFVEASARTGDAVDLAFTRTAEVICDRIKESDFNLGDSVGHTKDPDGSKRYCGPPGVCHLWGPRPVGLGCC